MAREQSDDEDSLSSTSSDLQEAVNLNADEEWQDAEPDQESLEFVSLFDDAVFPSFEAMLDHCKTKFDFDLQRVVKGLGLDFYGAIKLVNYIRSEAAKGNSKPDVTSKDVLDNDEYLKPVLQDDAVLFCLDDIIEAGDVDDSTGAESKSESKTDSSLRVKELEEQLQKIQEQFAEYRQAVGKTLYERWAAGSSKDNGEGSGGTTEKPKRDDDTHYFDSYSYSEIHETMLKDTPRTASYRDFIYDNKRLFTDKLVLDVGCGTGILSMFSARAGARHVVAADNSAIIDRAREIISVNGLGSRITCARGKVEDMASLPLPPVPHGNTSATAAGKVDILVSEWMGYMLLYEAMLDSVISARDRFLDPTDGLMVPSHVTLRIAPVADPEYISDSVAWWADVYGFDMRAMTRHMHDDVLVRSVDAKHLAGESALFRTLDLHTVSVEELVFEAPFEVVLERDVDALDAWAVWFDTFFLPGRGKVLPPDAKAEAWKGEEGVAFTTGPGGTTTHWQAGLLVVDRTRNGAEPLRKGQKIVGTIAYKKREVNSRELEVRVKWEADGTGEKGEQMWIMW